MRQKKQQKTDKTICARLFVYGTLQHDQSRGSILKNLHFKRAILPKFRKIVPAQLGYPIILKDKDSLVEGEVYFGLDQSLFEKLDIIEDEGNLYHRTLVNIKTQEVDELLSFVYYPSETLIGYVNDISKSKKYD